MGIYVDRVSRYGATGFFPGFLRRLGKFPLGLVIVFLGVSLMGGGAWAQPLPGPPGNPFAPASLKFVDVIEPPNLNQFLRTDTPGGGITPEARAAAIALGKALLWDMQLGSDGQTACATCHFHAGADVRTRNTLNPGFNRRFNVGPANSVVTDPQFPFHQRVPPVDFQSSPVLRDSDDVVGSQGVRLTTFVDIKLAPSWSAVETGTPLVDPLFRVGGAAGFNVRQVTGRNAPTYINAAFNFDTFWDGRANVVFNGVNPFGPADDNARVFVNDQGLTLTPETVRMKFAALASQAVGPPTNTVEMSFVGRTFQKIGKKMLHAGCEPLALQDVRADDSVLGPLANSPNPSTTLKGLNTSYAALIQAAFQDRFWNNNTHHVELVGGVPTVVAGAAGADNTAQFNQMEANFSLFLGISMMLFENTLISNDTPFDKFQEGFNPAAFGPTEELGLELLLASGCGACHAGPEFAGHNQIETQGFAPIIELPVAAIGLEFQVRFGPSHVDEGIYNVGVRPTREDVGRGGFTANGLDTRVRPLNRNRNFPLSYSALAMNKFLGRPPGLPAGLAAFVPDLPQIPPPNRRVDMTQGAFKVPSFRNMELTGPFLHNGSVATLGDVLDFYTRGGNFPRQNARNLHPAIVEIGILQNQEARHVAILAFLNALTDERVRQEAKPFDHPEIIIPNGINPTTGVDLTFTRPAVGAGGRAALIPPLPPLKPFLDPANP